MPFFYYIIFADFIILAFLIKLIFGSASVLKKAIIAHIFSDFCGIETLRKWDKEHDVHHKMNLLYAAILGVFGFSFLLYTQL